MRLWSEGDDRRFIDRNATARTGELHVRTHHDERDRAVVLVADFRPSMLFGTRRALRSVAAAEALVLLGWRIVGDGTNTEAWWGLGGHGLYDLEREHGDDAAEIYAYRLG